MKIRSTSPFWPLRDGIVYNFPALDEDLSCDIAIIGGGLCGAMVAYHLTEAGIDTVLVDKRDIAAGSTSASTALVMYEIDLMMQDLSKLRGEKFAVESYRTCFESTKKIEKIMKKLGRDCGFERKNSLFLAKRRSDVVSLKKEYELRKKFGFEIEYLDQKEIEKHFSFSRPAGLLTHDDAEVDPYLLTKNLLEYSKKNGLQVYDRTNVTKIERSTKNTLLSTDRGYKIKAKRIVYATGYESPDYVKRIVKLKSSFAIASEPVSDFNGWGYDTCLIWELGSPYLYIRTTRDGRLIVGGEDEDFVNPTKRDEMIGSKAAALLRKAKKMFPEIDIEIAYAWAGTFGETEDGLPYIGEVKKFPLSYFALCYGANGTNFALIGAETIRDLYLGRMKPSENLFRFGRK